MTSYTDAERIRFTYGLIAELIENPAADLVGSTQAWCNVDEDPALCLVVLALTAFHQYADFLCDTYGEEEALTLVRTVAMGAQIESIFGSEGESDASTTTSRRSS